MYLCVGENCYVYNYGLKLFYQYRLPCILGFCQKDRLYFCTKEGIFAVGGNTDDGKRIPAVWKSKLLDFSDKRKEKKLFVTTLVANGGEGDELDVSFRSDNETEKVTKRVCFSGKSEGERFRLRTPKRRFGAMEVAMQTDSEKSVHIL